MTRQSIFLMARFRMDARVRCGRILYSVVKALRHGAAIFAARFRPSDAASMSLGK